MLMKTFKVILVLVAVFFATYLAYPQGPPDEFLNPTVDHFWITIDANQLIVPAMSGGSSEVNEGEDLLWSYYIQPPNTPWYNIWFYDDPPDMTRMKRIRMGFYVMPYNPSMDGTLSYVVNWSTPPWHDYLNPHYPTPADEKYIRRSEMNGPVGIPYNITSPGQWVELFYEIPYYNPEWVSVDIYGQNIIISMYSNAPPTGSPLSQWWDGGNGGTIVHECLPKGNGTEFDFGDAPENDTAYIENLVMGNFPTCTQVGPNGFISHGCPSKLFFGGYVDCEFDGNAGYCPTFGTNWYNMDECGTFPYPFPPNLPANPVDEGLFMPIPNSVFFGWPSFYGYAACGTDIRQPLATVCNLAQWGQDIDIWIDASQFADTGYFNILFDWNQDGDWKDVVQCQGYYYPEHALVNWIIPPGFIGPASSMQNIPPPVQVGPNSGYVWARFTLTDTIILMLSPWDGSGVFTEGETEDYLLYIAPESAIEYDFGDAPEGDTAYINPVVIGNFPTCTQVGPNGFIRHNQQLLGVFFGGYVDTELDGNAGNCPTFGPNQYNLDECGTFPYIIPPTSPPSLGNADEGLIMPMPNSLVLQPGNYITCGTGARQALDTVCHLAQWGQDIDIWIDFTQGYDSEAFLNIWFDWNQDGDWNDTVQCHGTNVFEHAIYNSQIGYRPFLGPASTLQPPFVLPPIQVGPNSGYVWARFTISQQSLPYPCDPFLCDGSGDFSDGETEDYLLYIAPNPAVIPVSNWALYLGISLIVMFTLLFWWRKR
jgi:hypothetical protein